MPQEKTTTLERASLGSSLSSTSVRQPPALTAFWHWAKTATHLITCCYPVYGELVANYT